MTKNNYNKIAKHFTYNNIGLVDSIIFESGAKVAYTYSMSGEKLRVRHYAAPETMVSTQPSDNGLVPYLPGGSLISYDEETYYGADVVESNSFSGLMRTLPSYKYYFGNGYMSFSSRFMPLQSTFYYYSKDHLGNIRSVVKANANGTGTEQQVTHYYPFGGIIADLSDKGRNVQNRLYNGKELDTSNNLWWYDYGARQYDPTAPRFTTPDSLAEKYYGWNMYGYAKENPIRFIDQNGEFPQKWQADAARFLYKVTHPSKNVSPVIENTNSNKSSYRYTFNSVAKKGDNYEITAVHKLDKSFVQKTQDFGDGVTLVGYGLILSVEGAEIGVPVAKAGEAISGAGALGEIGIDIINGDLGNLSKEGLFYLANKAIEFGLKKSLPGFNANFNNDNFNLGTAIIEHGTSLKESLIQRTFDAAIDKNEENKKEK